MMFVRKECYFVTSVIDEGKINSFGSKYERLAKNAGSNIATAMFGAMLLLWIMIIFIALAEVVKKRPKFKLKKQ